MRPGAPPIQPRAPVRSGIALPALSLGAAPIAGLYEPVAEADARATVRRALARGMRYLDTAPHYGTGLSERRVGIALADAPRSSFLLSTKVGRRLEPLAPGARPATRGFADGLPYTAIWDWSRDGIRRSLADSLDRLGLARVDIVYLHDPDRHERDVYAHAYPALAELRAEGVVRAIGVGMNRADMLARFVRRLDLDVVLLAGRYSLLDQRGLDELLPACLRAGVGAVVAGVYNSGLLADPRPGARFDYAPADAALVERALRLAEVCEAHGSSLKAAALQFPFGHPAVVSVLVGCRSAAEVDENCDRFARPLPGALWTDLRDAGLLPPHVPVPSAAG